MKICNTEAMKLVKEYDEQKSMILDKEYERSCISYKEDEKKIAEKYDYDSTRKAVRELDEKVRRIKSALAAANCSTVVDGFGISIGEALVLLAQLRGQKERLDDLCARRQLVRRITQNGIVEYTECLYDVEEAAADAKAVRNEISRLQLAIDRANLTTYIEV